MKWAAIVVCVGFVLATNVVARAAPTPNPSPSSTATPSPSPSSTPTPVDDATQKTIAANYALGCTAALNPSDANLDAAFANLAADFINIDPTGKQESRDEMVSLAKQQMKMLHAKSCDHAIASISATDPGTVVVVTTLHVAGELQAPDGKHDLDLIDKAQDTWKNVGGKWQEAQSKDLHVIVKIDGNVVQELGS